MPIATCGDDEPPSKSSRSDVAEIFFYVEGVNSNSIGEGTNDDVFPSRTHELSLVVGQCRLVLPQFGLQRRSFFPVCGLHFNFHLCNLFKAGNSRVVSVASRVMARAWQAIDLQSRRPLRARARRVGVEFVVHLNYSPPCDITCQPARPERKRDHAWACTDRLSAAVRPC